jgi:UDP-N-acetylglucosamine:LPS N-acetylglucosamine transferase
MVSYKLLAVASIGGHWIQLLHIVSPLNTELEIIYLSTHPKCADMVKNHKFYTIIDFSRWDFYKLFPAFLQAFKIIWKEKPKMVITTGAAPGMIVLFVAKLFGKKTVWIDSIANVAQISFSGKIASKFATETYTQWESLATSKILYAGNVFESIEK